MQVNCEKSSKKGVVELKFFYSERWPPFSFPVEKKNSLKRSRWRRSCTTRSCVCKHVNRTYGTGNCWRNCLINQLACPNGPVIFNLEMREHVTHTCSDHWRAEFCRVFSIIAGYQPLDNIMHCRNVQNASGGESSGTVYKICHHRTHKP